MKGALIALGVIIVAAVAVSGVILRGYNLLDTERHDIQERWIQLDKDMKGRASLVPALVESLKATRNQEQIIIGEAEKARSALLAAQTKQDEMTANSRLSSALLTLQHGHAQLTAAQSLQDADQNIAQDGTDYNEAIQKYNTDLQLFPNNLVASIFRFHREDGYFQAPEQKRDLSQAKF